ncbi:hypothetical protein M9H77_02050 [Catharanthus roseus]|uniref:Uncharacterized protein n=1 Tax=Catharanthus roseus TaxID=4058 RepID=A0ACC0C7P5_CATRO|nr:hypothetical protein M9H77_02050 [Catharanthus roseus]
MVKWSSIQREDVLLWGMAMVKSATREESPRGAAVVTGIREEGSRGSQNTSSRV